MKCYWFYFIPGVKEYYFYVENKMDILQKVDKNIIEDIIKEGHQLYSHGVRYIFDIFSKKVKMLDREDFKLYKLCSGEKIIPLKGINNFVNSNLNSIIRYHLSPKNKYVFGVYEIVKK